MNNLWRGIAIAGIWGAVAFVIVNIPPVMMVTIGFILVCLAAMVTCVIAETK